jgi:hypothetical protein
MIAKTHFEQVPIETLKAIIDVEEYIAPDPVLRKPTRKKRRAIPAPPVSSAKKVS